MKTNYILLIYLLVFTSIMSCKDQQTQITEVSDYQTYFELVENTTLQTAIDDMHFWEKRLEKEPEQFPYLVQLAASYSQLFSLTGKVEYLKKAEENLELALEVTQYKKASYLRSLARNYITQHRFNDALHLLKKAESIGENLKATQKMLFDVHLELGNFDLAEGYLAAIKNFSDFDYLIRTSKWHDHLGNLQAAIIYMEKAVEIAEASKNKGIMKWSYSNLADFYGHDGQIDKSYKYYLKTLEVDPSDAYAKKGIAWIIYSYERNPEQALDILNAISTTYHAPDYWLLKAEIYDYMNNEESKSICIDKFLKDVDNEDYGVMYNMHKASVILEELKIPEIAIDLSHQEVAARATPETYDMLAWSYFKNDNTNMAFQIAKNHIDGKTFEPMALFHVAQIYKANGLDNKAQEIKKDLLESTYELGPLLEQQILNL